jgi:hypothetical protein
VVSKQNTLFTNSACVKVSSAGRHPYVIALKQNFFPFFVFKCNFARSRPPLPLIRAVKDFRLAEKPNILPSHQAVLVLGLQPISVSSIACDPNLFPFLSKAGEKNKNLFPADFFLGKF